MSVVLMSAFQILFIIRPAEYVMCVDWSYVWGSKGKASDGMILLISDFMDDASLKRRM